MLELINAARVQAGLSPVVLGDNVAAQLHAEASSAAIGEVVLVLAVVHVGRQGAELNQ